MFHSDQLVHRLLAGQVAHCRNVSESCAEVVVCFCLKLFVTLSSGSACTNHWYVDGLVAAKHLWRVSLQGTASSRYLMNAPKIQRLGRPVYPMSCHSVEYCKVFYGNQLVGRLLAACVTHCRYMPESYVEILALLRLTRSVTLPSGSVCTNHSYVDGLAAGTHLRRVSLPGIFPVLFAHPCMELSVTFG